MLHGLGCGQGHEFKLAAPARLARSGSRQLVFSIWLQEARLDVVSQADSEHLANHTFPQNPVLNRERHFDPAKQIPRQPVSAADEYFRLAAANSIADNQILAVQQPGEELIVSIRGRLYRIIPQ